MKLQLEKYKYVLGVAIVFLCSLGLFSQQVIGVRETLTEPEAVEAGLTLSQILPTAPPSAYAKLVIVIDDFGESRAGVEQMLALPVPLTTAVMPFLPYSEADGEAAQAAGHEVILHIPFYTDKVPTSWLGPRCITSSMEKTEIDAFLDEAFAQLPMARGINNHIGPMGCENSFTTDCVLAYLSSHQKYLIDSATSLASNGESSAANLAGLHQMENRVFRRTFFLDGSEYPTVEATKSQLKKAVAYARETGLAIVIGHVGPEGGERTAQAISEMQSWIAQQNVTVVRLSEI